MSKRTSGQSRIEVKSTKRKLRKRIKYVLIPLILAFLAVFTYGAYLYIKADSAVSEAYEDDGREKSELRDALVDPKFDNVSVLIMGIDQNEKREDRDDPTRTDALILATLNKDEQSVKLLSIPRDSYVYIPEVGYEDKINHAHAFGGHQATIETVENLFDIPVDYFVRLNFHAFVDVIDAIGGVQVEVPYEFQESDSNDKRDNIHLHAGIQTLSGEEALALARTRKLDSDVERGKRQLEIIDAVINKATSVSSLFKYDEVIEAVGNNMSTNLSFSEMRSFLSYATQGSSLDVEKISLEGHDYQPGSIYYYQLDEFALEETKNTLKSHLDLSTYAEETSEETDEYQSAEQDIYETTN